MKASQRVLFGVTILLSAFLLFQVQPLIAKLILPWFGGSAAVWTSCMLFFQMALLGGYAYAHWLIKQTTARQTIIHPGLLALSLLSLPILPSAWWKPEGAADPLLRILGLLAVTVGLPYFLLSSTSPLLQSWYSRSTGGAMPYRFFALSNIGSMLGLLSYPILVEPNLTNRTQAWMWSVAYVAFALVCAIVAIRSHGKRIEESAAETEYVVAPRLADRLLWVSLAACASALLLAVTNHLTQNIAPIPFLWVLPLCLYLLSFILCFESDRWYRRPLFTGLGAIALSVMAWEVIEADISSLRLAVGFFCAAIFVIFMVCHGELARRRPAPAHLTSFFLMISLGGATGGLLIGFAAPYLFNALYDFPVVLSITALLFAYLLWRERIHDKPDALTARRNDTVMTVAVSVVFLACVLFRVLAAKRMGAPRFLNAWYDPPLFFGLAGIALAWLLVRGKSSFNVRLMTFVVGAGLAAAIVAALVRDSWTANAHSRALARNFYGALNVYDTDGGQLKGPVRILQHGTIDHGEQFLWPQNRHLPTAYFTEQSGIGLAMRELQRQGPMHVGIIGLGAGTLTAYARPGDRYRIYDINPLVLKIAETQFTFLRDCPAPHDVVLGDARLALENEPTQGFDLLVVDAFSGDAIPVHLLTRQAWELYWRHLKPDGVLAVHVSNKYLRLPPVVALGAEESGKRAMLISYSGDEEEEAASDWVIVSSRPGFFESSKIKSSAELIKPIPGLHPWTDDYSDVYRILR
jgi:SAM-dependent methyltransferase